MLVDPELTSVRLVLNPEKMVIQETQRTYTYFNLFGYPCDLAICNRVIPASVQDAYFSAWKETQARHRSRSRSASRRSRCSKHRFFKTRSSGWSACGRWQAIYGDDDPRGSTGVVAASVSRRPTAVTCCGCRCPFTEKRDVELTKLGDELLVLVGQHRRKMILPRILVGLEPAARFDGDELLVSFLRRDDIALRTGSATAIMLGGRTAGIGAGITIEWLLALAPLADRAGLDGHHQPIGVATCRCSSSIRSKRG